MRWRKPVFSLAFLALGVYAAMLAALFVFQRSFLYFPDTRRPELSDAGVPGVEEARLKTADGLDLHAWYLPPGRADAPVAVYFHGNGGNIAYRRVHLAAFAAAGWGALMVEYRGYGGNPGSPSEAGLFADARAGIAFLQGRGVGRERLVLYGESLGTGVAVAMASEGPAAALVLESPYTSVAALAKQRLPFVPIDLLLKDRFDALSRIGRVAAPILVLQAGRDEVIPVASGQALFAAAPQPKEIWVAPEAFHNDLALHGSAEAAIAFVDRHRAPGG